MEQMYKYCFLVNMTKDPYDDLLPDEEYEKLVSVRKFVSTETTGRYQHCLVHNFILSNLVSQY
jgi:hypothetical protein